MDAITGTFPEGIIHEGKLYRQFSLAPEAFCHSLALMSDPDVDTKQLHNDTYFRAALFAQRLTVPGIKKITPDMVLYLSGDDGQELLSISNDLEKRRKEFRRSLETAAENASCDAEAGAELAGHQPDGSGGS